MFKQNAPANKGGNYSPLGKQGIERVDASFDYNRGDMKSINTLNNNNYNKKGMPSVNDISNISTPARFGVQPSGNFTNF